ncbi:MAG: ABC transporter ATP-binding protein [Desulfurococcaceae archaeon]
MAFLRLVNVTKKYGNHIAVNKVNLEVEKGEFIVILGPSGSGKSTLLRLIAGLEDPDEGEIFLDNVKINDIDPKDRDIAMVFQSYAVYPHMTVYQNIEFPLRMRKIPEHERRVKVNEVAKLLGITHLLDKKAWQLSGGEQQRVALARALVRNPKLFLLDEPLSNLDAKLRIRLRFELRKLLHDELRITTIHVTHDQVEAMTMADRIAIMNDGKIIQVGTPHEVYNQPRNTFIATFIGSPPMNILQGKLEQQHVITLQNMTVRTRKPLDILGEVLVGIRPQHLELRAQSPGIKGKIVSYENLGEELIVHVDTQIGELQVVIPVKDLSEYVIGQEVFVKPRGPLYLFNESSGEIMQILEPGAYEVNQRS